MNIFGIGGAELVLIFVIMLIVAGPKRMIRWAYVLGQYVAKMRRMWEDVVDMMQDEADAAGLDITIPKELPSKQSLTKLVVDAVKPYSDELKQPLEELKAPLRDTVAEANALVKSKPEKLGEAPKNDLGAWNTPKDEAAFGSWGQAGQGEGNHDSSGRA